MIHGMTRWGSLVGSVMIAIGCGGSPKGTASSPSATASAVTPSDATTDSGAATSDAAVVGAAQSPQASLTSAAPSPPPPPAHPFASNGAEATSLIDDAITSRVNELGECVEAARTRRKSPHERIVLEVGIDEEGHMLGVKLPKGEKNDKALVDCVLTALRGAPFPRSHSGVITVRKTFEDKAVYK